jgi:hypothetical protein
MAVAGAGFDGQIELEALRLCGLLEGAPALLCDTPALPVGRREFAWDLPNLAPGATSSSASSDACLTSWTSNTPCQQELTSAYLEASVNSDR